MKYKKRLEKKLIMQQKLSKIWLKENIEEKTDNINNNIETEKDRYEQEKEFRKK